MMALFCVIPAGSAFPALPGFQRPEPPVSVTVSVTVVHEIDGIIRGAIVSTAILTVRAAHWFAAVSWTFTIDDQVLLVMVRLYVMTSGPLVRLGTQYDQRFVGSPFKVREQAQSDPSLIPGESEQVTVAVTGLLFQYSAVTSVVPVPLLT